MKKLLYYYIAILSKARNKVLAAGKVLILLTVFLLITYHLSLITSIFAQDWQEGTEFIRDVKDQAGKVICQDCNVATLQGIEAIFRLILRVSVLIAVLVVFIMLVIGGFKYLTSGGDQKATESARNTLTYAIFGLAALIGIWLILKFVEVFTGVKVTEFKIIP